MSINVEIADAQAHLKDLIAKLRPDEEVVITEHNRAVARLIAAAKPQPKFGSCRGMLNIVAEDDEHLQDFKEYMP